MAKNLYTFEDSNEKYVKTTIDLYISEKSINDIIKSGNITKGAAVKIIKSILAMSADINALQIGYAEEDQISVFDFLSYMIDFSNINDESCLNDKAQNHIRLGH